MNCTDEPHTEETLSILHERMCHKLQPNELLTYLMDSVPYIKTGDMTGWKKMFEPVIEPIPVKPKRLRQSPAAFIYTPLDPCVECGSVDVLDDTPNGQWVCMSCGLIQQLGVCTGDIAHCSYDRIKNGNRVYIHRYSRVVHFRAVISQLTGNSNPLIDEETRSRMQAELDGKNIGVHTIGNMIRSLGISRRYQRHTASIVRIFGGAEPPEGEIPADVYMKMMKMFMRTEYVFNFKRKELCPGRKAFFSYKFLLYQFLCELGAYEWAHNRYLLKCRHLLNKQMTIYEAICGETGFELHMRRISKS
jgi:hypothetical protein